MATPSLPLAGRLITPAGIFLLALFFLVLAFTGWQHRESQWTSHLAAQSEIQQLAVAQSQQALKRQALMAASSLAEDPDTLRLIRRIALVAQRDGLDNSDVIQLRAQLQQDLSGFWEALQRAGASQLHIHLSPDVTSLLRMHRPELWGDSLAQSRPLLADTQRTGQPRNGMEVGRFGLGMIGVVPIRGREGTTQSVLATLEVGFGMLPELRQLDRELRAGLAVLLHSGTLDQLRGEHDSTGLEVSPDGKWVLDSYSRPEIREWLATDQVSVSWSRDSRFQVLQSGDHHHLVTRIPVRDLAGELDPQRPPVGIVVAWRDITEALAEHRAEQMMMLFKWLLAFLAATLLLTTLLHLTRSTARKYALRQSKRQHLALRALNEIAGLPNLDVTERLQQALKLGSEYLGMEIGIVSRIEGNDYTIVAQRNPDDLFREGDVLALPETFCSLVLEQRDVLDLQRIGQSEFRHHPAYQKYAIETYVGAPLMVDGRHYGTLSFSSLESERKAIGDIDIEFMRLCSRWISSTLTRARAEREREAVLSRFHKLSQHLPGMVYQYQLSADGKGRFPYCSDGIRAIYGVSPKQVAADDSLVFDRVHPDDEPSLSASVARSAEELSTWKAEYRVLHPDFGELWVTGQASPEKLDNGDIIWHGFIADITARKHMELTLDRERSRLASIIDSTNIGAGEWDLVTGEIAFNERWAETLGYTLKELEPVTIHTWMGLTHPDDLHESSRLLKEHLTGKTEFYSCKFRLRHKDGYWIWMHGRGKVIARDESGRALLMSGTHADITEEMRRDEEIRQARSFLRAVIDASTEVAVITTDLHGRITLFNSGAERLLGYRAGEVVGFTTLELFHAPAELERRATTLKQELGEALAGMEVLLAKVRGGKSETLPWTYVRKDGGQRLVNLTITPIIDEGNQPIGFLAMANDISDLIQATRALQKSESRFRSMVANLPGAVFRCVNDADWTMSYMSDEIAQITGYPAAEFIDSAVRSFASIIHPDDLPSTYAIMDEIKAGRSYELTYRIIHADGREIWVREKGRGEHDGEGQLLWSSGFIWDATEQHRIEQMKTQFVSTVSHELRTPLTAISGSLALITGGALGEPPAQMKKLLEIAQRNSQNLNSLINDLLDMDKLAVDKMHFASERVRLEPELLRALEENQSYAAQHQVTLAAGDICAAWLTVDPQRFAQVLANYLSNAAKFSPPGGTVTLSAQWQRGRVLISVEDHGDGIAHALQHRVFSKFFQADASDTRKRGGTGLGLAITRELVEHMGGEVGFHSVPGAGSTFWCLFDAEPVEGDTP